MRELPSERWIYERDCSSQCPHNTQPTIPEHLIVFHYSAGKYRFLFYMQPYITSQVPDRRCKGFVTLYRLRQKLVSRMQMSGVALIYS